MSAAYYTERGRRPRNCWDCDGVHACRCDTVTIRAVKRGAKSVWRARMIDESRDPPDEFFRELAADRFEVSAMFREMGATLA